MKRLLLAAAGLVAGSFCFISPASAQPVESVPTSVSAVAPASGSPTKVLLTAAAAPTLQRYRVVSGDTLWGIGVRYLGSGAAWSRLASYNHIPNPSLIYVGDVINIPPATYTASAPISPSAPVHTQYKYAPTKQQVTTPVSHTRTSYAPHYAGAPGSFQSCVATRESGNGSGSSNIYGILNSTWASLGRSGSAWTASRAEQDAAFAQLYAKDGIQPWAPYDGC
jgi:LysM repeat protein